MTLAVRFRPRVNFCANAVQQAQINAAQENLENLREMGDTGIAGMTARIKAQEALFDSKVPPVQEVAEEKPLQHYSQSVAESGSLNQQPSVTDVIKNFHKGKTYSKVEHSNMLMNQMNQYAVSNMVLHGLV